MKYLKLSAAALALAITLTACGGIFGGLEGMGGGTIDSGAAPVEDKSEQQALVDRILGDVDGMEQRALRVRFIAAAYSELAVPAARTDPERTMELLGNVRSLQELIKQFDAADYSGIFLETDMSAAALALARVLTSAAESSIRADLIGLVDGVDIGNVRERVRLRAVQAYTTLALQRDIKRTLQEVRDGRRTVAEVKAAIDQRISANETRLLL